MTPAQNSASVMMPIVFWASFEPWAKAMNPAEKTCSRRKTFDSSRGPGRPDVA